MNASRFAIVIALIFLLSGCGGVKVREDNSSSAAQPDIAGQSANRSTPSEPPPEKPLLSCEVRHVSLYQVPSNPENLAVSVVVSVSNSGAPSTAQDWKLTVQSSVGTAFGSLDPVHVNGVVEMPGAKGTRVDLAKEDLALKSKQTPVTKATRLMGVLTFVLPKTSLHEMSNNQSSFVIHFKDDQGGLYRSPKTIIGANSAR